MNYTMVFAISPGFKYLVILRKPQDHKNPLFRGRWTVPGGKVEEGERLMDCARRELREEAGLDPKGVFRVVLTFICNCDPTEGEHMVTVYAVTVPVDEIHDARGTVDEPVEVVELRAVDGMIPANTIWHIPSLLELAKGRLLQQFADSTSASTDARSTTAVKEQE